MIANRKGLKKIEDLSRKLRREVEDLSPGIYRELALSATGLSYDWDATLAVDVVDQILSIE